jgi:hypothetical protein
MSMQTRDSQKISSSLSHQGEPKPVVASSLSTSTELGQLRLPHTPERTRAPGEGHPVTKEDLAAVQNLTSRIRIPWRFFIANSAFLQISIPEIAAIVSSSQRYKTDPKARIEGTRTFLKTLINEGPDSAASIAAIEKVNEVHRAIGITSDTAAFTFVIYTLSFGFIDSLRRNSSVNPSAQEELAVFHLMRRVGERMGASVNLHSDYPAFVEANQRFQRERWASDSLKPRNLATSLLESAFARVPQAARPFLTGVALSLVAPETVRQLHLKEPPQFVRAMVRRILKTLT